MELRKYETASGLQHFYAQIQVLATKLFSLSLQCPHNLWSCGAQNAMGMEYLHTLIPHGQSINNNQ